MGVAMFGEHGRVGHLEQLAMTHDTSEGNAILREYATRSIEMMLDPGYRITGIIPGFVMRLPPSREEREKMTKEEHDKMVRLYPHNEHLWLEEIKKTFDPNSVSDDSFYSI